MKNLVLVILVGLGAFSAADPLAELDSFLGCTELSASFRMGDAASVKAESCLGKRCDSFSVRQEVTDANASQAVVSSFGSDGKLFQQSQITAQEWKAQHCNMARFHVMGMQNSGFQVQVSEPVVSQVTLKVNGVEQQIATRRIEIEGSNRVGMKTHHILELATGVGGLAQMVVRQQNNFSSGMDRFTIEEVQIP